MKVGNTNMRSVLHMDLDTFFVSVERLKDSRLVGKPLIIGGKSRRGVVASCSYETRRFGVHSAMPMRMALQLCPDALVISGDMESYSQYSNMVTDIVREQAPKFEKSSVDEFYLDLTGMDRFIGCYKWSTELRARINRETGLPLSFGLSVNKMVSKVATGEAKPDGQRQIVQGEERDFLAPMRVEKIPLIGTKSTEVLRSMGVYYVYTLREIPREYLQQLFGKNGTMMWKRANAIDDSPVVPYDDAKSMSAERTFQKDTIDVVFLKAMLVRLTEKLSHKLRESNKLTGCITVKIRYSSFDTFTRQKRITYTSADHTLIAYALELFDKLYERRILIRLIGVRLSGLVQGNYQINLFEDTEESIRLYQAIDKMKRKYGADSLVRAASLGVGTSARSNVLNPFHG